MRILIDADACPSIDMITSIAKEYKLPLILYSYTTHNLKSDYALIETLSKGFQSVDIKIINDLNMSDILITQDFGLATLALAKNCEVISPKGLIYTNDNIDRLNFEKYLNSLNRRQKIHIKGPKKRTIDDSKRLEDSIIKCIKENM